MRYPDIYKKYDYDTMYNAVDDVASFHAGAEELGSSDINIMIRQVLKRLEESEGVAEGLLDRFKKEPQQPEDPSYKKGREECDKDPSADPQFLFRKFGGGLDWNQFMKGFNDNAKSRGMKIHGDVSGDVDHPTLRYKEFKRNQGVAEGSDKTPKIMFVQTNPGSNSLIDIFVDGRKTFLAAKTVGPGFWSIYPLGPGTRTIGGGGSKSQLKKTVLDYLSKQGVAEGYGELDNLGAKFKATINRILQRAKEEGRGPDQLTDREKKAIAILKGEQQGVAENNDQKYSVTIDAIDHGVLGAITVSASSPDEAKRKVISGVKKSWAKRGDELMVRSISVKPIQGVAEEKGTLWRVHQSEATGRYHVVKGYNKDIKMFKNKMGAGDFNSKAAAQAKADELNSNVTEDQLDELKCWDGYKRVPGTKAGAPGSCEEIEEGNSNELSTDLLARYKTAAGADARAADKAGDFARGNTRFTGIVKATKKQFDNETKPKKESAIMKGLVDENLGTPYPGTYEQEVGPFKRKGPERTMKLTTEGKKNVSRRT